MKHSTQYSSNRVARLGVLAILLCSIGCNGSSTTSSGTSPSGSSEEEMRRSVTVSNAGLVPQSRPPVPDIPIPVGFKIAEAISRNFESAGSRYIDHTYEGYADKMEVDRFYAAQMPLKDWTLRGRQMVRGEYILRFDKASEFAEVRINSESTFTGSRTTINVNVQTLGRGENKAYQKN